MGEYSVSPAGKPSPAKNQTLLLKNREELTLSGVEDVVAFDDRVVTVRTVLGVLEVGGTSLRIREFDASGGELSICGKISVLSYQEAEEKKRGWFRR